MAGLSSPSLDDVEEARGLAGILAGAVEGFADLVAVGIVAGGVVLCFALGSLSELQQAA